MSRRDRTEVLNALLPRCRQGDREAFVEVYKHREVGLVLGIAEGTSKSQLFRAREMLRRWLSHPSEVSA